MFYPYTINKAMNSIRVQSIWYPHRLSRHQRWKCDSIERM